MLEINGLFEWGYAGHIALCIKREGPGTKHWPWMTRFMRKSLIAEWVFFALIPISFTIGAVFFNSEHQAIAPCCFMAGITFMFAWLFVLANNLIICFSHIKRWRWASTAFPVMMLCTSFMVFYLLVS